MLSVEAALGAFRAGAFTDDSLIAVAGWLEAPLPMSCPYDLANPHPAALERACGWMDHILSRDPQQLVTTTSSGGISTTTGQSPVGPYLAPREPFGAPISEALQEYPPTLGNGYSPRYAILVGHVHDPRAVLCPPDKRAECDLEFVVDQVAWLDGESLGPTFWVGGDATGQILLPRLHEDGVLRVAAAAMPPGSVVVWMSALRAADLGTVDPKLHPAVSPDSIVWFIRYVVPASAGRGTASPMASPAGRARSGWILLADATAAAVGT